MGRQGSGDPPRASDKSGGDPSQPGTETGYGTLVSDRVFQQTAYQVRFAWGQEGVRRLAPLSAAVVIVDVLSFTTCVDVAVSRGARIFPYRYRDASAAAFAKSVDALLAGERGATPSLSPASLMELAPDTRVVLPSPNGSTCTVVAAESDAEVVAGSLRNAFAVADYLQSRHPTGVITVIGAGEHWPNGSLRPAIEDLIGAGAILSRWDGAALSPEAAVAVSAFQSAGEHLKETLKASQSGQELTAKGFFGDVMLAGELSVSSWVPVFHDGVYVGVR
jgi:2-phosphosulfolactate phosphatase